MERLKDIIRDLGTGKNIKKLEIRLKTLRRKRRHLLPKKI